MLVVIGLITGGVLMGQSLVNAAGVRATITQIEKFQTAAVTFYGKYGFLPGDIPAGPAAQFGLAPRGTSTGQGDGNGILVGIYSNSLNSGFGTGQGGGETAMFWADLATVGLMEGGFPLASSSTLASGTVTGIALSNYMPPAKIGGGNYVYVYSSGGGGGVGVIPANTNYFGLSAAGSINGGCGGCLASSPGLTSAQSAAIDTKMDDGLPAIGRVTVNYVNITGGGVSGVTYPSASPWNGSQSITCFNYPNGVPYSQYTYNLNNNVNCALSFRMQAGD